MGLRLHRQFGFLKEATVLIRFHQQAISLRVKELPTGISCGNFHGYPRLPLSEMERKVEGETAIQLLETRIEKIEKRVETLEGLVSDITQELDKPSCSQFFGDAKPDIPSANWGFA